MGYRIELLNKNRHNRQSFDCGIQQLNDYLKHQARQHAKRGISTTHVLTDADEPIGDDGLYTILGYYALSAAQLALTDLSESDRAHLPRWPVPAIRMGQLAVNRQAQGAGIGELLIADAVQRSLRARETTLGAVALVVDAIDARATQFYEHYGFRRCTAAPGSLYLPLGKP